MRALIERLSPRAEIAIVVLGAFGYFVAAELWRWAYPIAGHISEAHLQWLLVYEPIVAAILLVFLRLRGWTWIGLGLRLRRLDPILGVLAAIVLYGVINVAWLLAMSVSSYAVEAAGDQSFIATDYGLDTVLAVSLVNPVFEEVFVVGYLVTALRRHIPDWAAIGASTVVRLLYHLYQGPGAALTIVPWGLIFGWAFTRWGRLWPLIVAHALFDFVGLARFADPE
jgi:membrane protease YdiL (CAAX protease family)